MPDEGTQLHRPMSFCRITERVERGYAPGPPVKKGTLQATGAHFCELRLRRDLTHVHLPSEEPKLRENRVLLRRLAEETSDTGPYN